MEFNYTSTTKPRESFFFFFLPHGVFPLWHSCFSKCHGIGVGLDGVGGGEKWALK